MSALKFTTANLLETANKNKIQDCTGPIINLYTPYHIEILAKFRSCEVYFGPVVFRLIENWTFMFHCNANFCINVRDHRLAH